MGRDRKTAQREAVDLNIRPFARLLEWRDGGLVAEMYNEDLPPSHLAIPDFGWTDAHWPPDVRAV